MKQQKLSVQQALDLRKNYPFSWVRTMSAVTIGAAEASFSMDELEEARFFGTAGELRLFRREDELEAVELSYEEQDMLIERKYRLDNPKKFGKTLTVRCVFQADEDGQCYVAATLLADWEGSGADG